MQLTTLKSKEQQMTTKGANVGKRVEIFGKISEEVASTDYAGFVPAKTTQTFDREKSSSAERLGALGPSL